jgi:hypothetical protein
MQHQANSAHNELINIQNSSFSPPTSSLPNPPIISSPLTLNLQQSQNEPKYIFYFFQSIVIILYISEFKNIDPC